MKKLKTFKQVLTLASEESFGRIANSVNFMRSCCGIMELNELHGGLSPQEQAMNLAEIMDGDYRNQIIFTDIIESKKLKATKKIAFKGPISINPDTGNKVRVYIVTRSMIPKIYNSK